jgi:membrane-associated protease RseP (regulator of RpoE activity)
MTSPAESARPLYEQIVTPGHVLSARLRTTLPTITRATVLAFALSAGAIGYFLAAGANSSLSRDVAAPVSKRTELSHAAASQFKFIGTAVSIPSDKIGDFVQIAEAKYAMNYARGQLANGKFAFDAAMMTKIDGAAFASGTCANSPPFSNARNRTSASVSGYFSADTV